MNLSKFIKEVRKTKPPKKNAFLISAIGVSTEAGEILDILKRQIKYGEKIDKVHLAEEIGDVLNYLVQLTDSQDINLEECLDANIAKMKVRYPNGFNKKKAIKRDTTKEKTAMSSALTKDTVANCNSNPNEAIVLLKELWDTDVDFKTDELYDKVRKILIDTISLKIKRK